MKKVKVTVVKNCLLSVGEARTTAAATTTTSTAATTTTSTTEFAIG